MYSWEFIFSSFSRFQPLSELLWCYLSILSKVNWTVWVSIVTHGPWYNYFQFHLAYHHDLNVYYAFMHTCDFKDVLDRSLVSGAGRRLLVDAVWFREVCLRVYSIYQLGHMTGRWRPTVPSGPLSLTMSSSSAHERLVQGVIETKSDRNKKNVKLKELGI